MARYSCAQRPKASLIGSRHVAARDRSLVGCAQRPKASLIGSLNPCSHPASGLAGAQRPKASLIGSRGTAGNTVGDVGGAQRPKASLIGSRESSWLMPPNSSSAQRPKASLIGSPRAAQLVVNMNVTEPPFKHLPFGSGRCRVADQSHHQNSPFHRGFHHSRISISCQRAKPLSIEEVTTDTDIRLSNTGRCLIVLRRSCAEVVRPSTPVAGCEHECPRYRPRTAYTTG